jgi:hypothetical protein
MDRRDMEELARQADRQAAADRARDATLGASSAGRKSGERMTASKPEPQERREDPGPIEGASGR